VIKITGQQKNLFRKSCKITILFDVERCKFV